MDMGVPSLFDHLVSRVNDTAGSEDPLARLDSAITVAAEATETGDGLLDHFVAQPRHAGCSWTDIGSRLGVGHPGARPCPRLFAPGSGPGAGAGRVLTARGTDPPGIRGGLSCYSPGNPRRRAGRWKRPAATTGRACSFCGRSEKVAGRLVAGPGV